MEDGQSDGSVPDVGSSETDSENTEERRARYCGYYRPMSEYHACPNDSSAQRYRCRLCQVICCKEFCLARQRDVCKHCKEAWPGVLEELEERANTLKERLLAKRARKRWWATQEPMPMPKTMPRPTTKPMPKAMHGSQELRQSRIPVGLVGGNVSFGGSSASTDSYTLPHHNRQRSRSRSPASNFVGSCPICFERPRNHCLVPCGHRMCLQCGLLCLPICPQCRGDCTLCIRVWD